VLITGPGRHKGQIGGRSPYLQAVHLEGPVHWAGRVVPVRITSARTNSLSGELMKETACA
jgi:tRNA-2-methylthio-N6-dimethylallyladenosine synthase